MDGDLGAAQEAIKDLATEGGLSFMKALTDQHLDQAVDSAAKTTTWKTQLCPLLGLITHPTVVDSSVLEQEVAMIYNFLDGVASSRGVRIFRFVISLIESWPALRSEQSSPVQAIELTLAFLSKLVDGQTTRLLNESYKDMVGKVSRSLQESDGADDEFSKLQATKYLDYINRRFKIGQDIMPYQSTVTPVVREQFVLRRDFPGTLSTQGPRHDNDSTDITKIRIMPTSEEILSPRSEYLPTTESSQWHVPGIQGRLDREFRLLREDTIGQLRDTVRDMLGRIRDPANRGRQQSRNGARTYTYNSADPIKMWCDKNIGWEIQFQFRQPQNLERLSRERRQDWWLHGKRLQEGALVCILDATGSTLFFQVSESTLRTSKDKPRGHQRQNEKEGQQSAAEKKLSLSDDDVHGFVVLRLVDSSDYAITQVLRWYRNIGSFPTRYLVEFPGILLASFKHTLEALQRMHDKPDLPFTNLLEPANSQQTVVQPPQYARKAGFSFDLTCLTTDGQPFQLSPQNPPSPQVISERTLLDETQSQALLDTLSRELALIQGPPETGKSFTGEKIIKCLIFNKKGPKLGPILCVCYPNHALDQLLEHLLDDGTKSIIRMGSRSKSERLQDLNLRTIAGKANRTKSAKHRLWELHTAMDDIMGRATQTLIRLEKCDSWGSIKSFLSREHEAHHDALFGHSQDGFEVQNAKPSTVFKRWLNSGLHTHGPPRSLDELANANLLTLSHEERQQLYQHWLRSIRDPLITQMVHIQPEYARTRDNRDKVRQDVDLRCLNEADVVGVTTTGLARNLDLLRKLRCKVMLCEEAGEVLESHLLTALLPTV
jgi:hypothetical protein